MKNKSPSRHTKKDKSPRCAVAVGSAIGYPKCGSEAWKRQEIERMLDNDRYDREQAAKRSPNPAPTVAGYWWTRPDSGCLWRVVEISIYAGRTYIEEMGEEGQDTLPACPWCEWAGPIAPPSPNAEMCNEPKNGE